jgi:hypothetical protein
MDTAKDQKLQALQETSSTYYTTTYVKSQVWATMPGEEEPNNKVAEECAKLLMLIGQ